MCEGRRPPPRGRGRFRGSSWGSKLQPFSRRERSARGRRVAADDPRAGRVAATRLARMAARGRGERISRRLDSRSPRGGSVAAPPREGDRRGRSRRGRVHIGGRGGRGRGAKKKNPPAERTPSALSPRGPPDVPPLVLSRRRRIARMCSSPRTPATAGLFSRWFRLAAVRPPFNAKLCGWLDFRLARDLWSVARTETPLGARRQRSTI
mmetsp:Transcript_1780/g.5030  ORF Transcript_1780/g.5030 Transcript_1780/m.5030 type:complete len:208 (+) Transcript_1780:956-1579(+)